MGSVLGNMGNAYYRKGDYDMSLDYIKKGLAIDEEIDNKKGIAHYIGNIALIHYAKGDLDKALNYLERSLALSEEMGDKGMMIYNFTQIGLVHYFKKTDFELAAKYMEKSQAIIDEIGTNEEDMIYTKVFLYLTYKQLSKTYDVQEIFELLKITKI